MIFFAAISAVVIIVDSILWLLFRKSLRTLAPLEGCCDTPLNRFIRARRMSMVAIIHALFLMTTMGILCSKW